MQALNQVWNEVAQDKNAEIDALKEQLDAQIELSQQLAGERDGLKARVEELESRSAGVWVPVTERLPEPLQVVQTFRAPSTITYGNWIDVRGRWVSQAEFWLEEKMPGEQHE
tara:strand:+ start:160 stop:495 length:336 start_codon:yes stop_codon:yes gene_type:complete